MTLIDGDKIVTAQLYDDEYEEFTEQKMSIIDYINAYTDEGVTMADDVLDKIRAEIAGKKQKINFKGLDSYEKAQAETRLSTLNELLQIIDKYRAESEDNK